MIGFSKRAGQVLATVGAAGLLWLSGTAAAAPFTPGNLVVYRVGVGGAVALVNTGSPVFLDEYTTAGALIQSIPLPTAAVGLTQKALVASGTATSDGYLTRSVDGNCLVVTGYGRDLVPTGSGTLTSTNATAVPRIVGRVMANATIDTSTALGDASSAGNFRGAASTNCSSFWVTGGGRRAIRAIPRCHVIN